MVGKRNGAVTAPLRRARNIPGTSPSHPRHRADRRRSTSRTVLALAGVGLVATVVALLASGGSYALWSDTANLAPATVTAGSSSLTVEGATEHAVQGLDLTLLAPGRSVTTPRPVAILNTGTTPLAVTVSTTTIPEGNGRLAEFLIFETAIDTGGAEFCDSAPSAAAPVAGETVSQSPVTVLPGEEAQLCFQVGLTMDAPASVQATSAAFAMTVTGEQVRVP